MAVCTENMISGCNLIRLCRSVDMNYHHKRSVLYFWEVAGLLHAELHVLGNAQSQFQISSCFLKAKKYSYIMSQPVNIISVILLNEIYCIRNCIKKLLFRSPENKRIRSGNFQMILFAEIHQRKIISANANRQYFPLRPLNQLLISFRL